MPSTNPSSAWFRFHYPPAPETFVFELRDAEKIAHARRILTGEEKEAIHVQGCVALEPAWYNPPWSFYFDPDSIDFFPYAIEVCDASICYVEEHRDEVGGSFLPECVWCPWGSELIEEIVPKKETDGCFHAG